MDPNAVDDAAASRPAPSSVQTPQPVPTDRVAVVLLAAGAGRRSAQAVNKVLLPLAGRTALGWCLHRVRDLPGLARVVVVARAGEEDAVVDCVAADPPGVRTDVVTGGSSRHASEDAALAVLREDVASGLVGVVVVHDSARPAASTRLFADVADAARRWGGALPGVGREGLVGLDGAGVRPTPPTDRTGAVLVGVQTPQAFRAAPLLEAYALAARDGFDGTDTAACLQRYRPDLVVRCVPGSTDNLKITWPDDLARAALLLTT